MISSLIEEYAAGGPRLAEAIRGLTSDDLLAYPVPGTWNIQQVVLHLQDSDLIGGDRMKRIAAEDDPQILAYDESKFASRLHYDRLDPHLACEIFALHRRQTASVLRLLSADAFERKGVHSERGPTTLANELGIYVRHLEHHLGFLREKRKALGKPLA